MLKAHDTATRGIVINRFSSGEGSARIHLFTENFGLISVLAQSAREERSKLRPHLQVGTFGNFDLVRGSKQWRVVGAVGTRDFYFSTTGKPKVQQAAARVLSLLRQLITGEEKDEDLFGLVWQFFSSLDQITEDTVTRAEQFVVFQILTALGFAKKEVELPIEQEFNYSKEALEEVERYTAQMQQAIKSGFAASGLL